MKAGIILLIFICIVSGKSDNSKKLNCKPYKGAGQTHLGSPMFLDESAFQNGQQLSTTIEENDSTIISSCMIPASLPPPGRIVCTPCKVDSTVTTLNGGKRYYCVERLWEFEILPSRIYISVRNGMVDIGYCLIQEK